MNSTHSKTPNNHLCHEREVRGWSQQDLAEKVGTSQKVVSRWERGESTPLPYYRQKLCKLFAKNAIELGFLDEQLSEDHPRAESAQNATLRHENVHVSLFDLGMTEKLDSAESIINLAWEAWFASRPSVAARSVNKLLPNLEQIAFSLDIPGHTLRAKNLALRAHGLLGSVCLDASQHDTAFFHYMQAYRFKEFIPFEVYEIRGKINRDLGKPLNALPYLELAERSLYAADSVTPRWHALLEISRAQTYCDAGDIATGIELACQGFIAAYQCRSPHQMNRVRKLLRKLEQGSFRHHPNVQDLKNLLSETYIHME
jgi:transcriptional regulator with XRE-family HTH domain